MGGNLLQFAELIDLFVGCVNILAIDWVGHGGTPDTGHYYDYLPTAIAQDVDNLISEFTISRQVVLIGHSYGCTIATLILAAQSTQLLQQTTQSTSLLQQTAQSTIAAVFLSPKAFFMPHELGHFHSWITYIPTFIIDILRFFDRRHGPYSTSVRRQLGSNASLFLRNQQLEWNKQLSSWQLKALLYGMHSYNQWPTTHSFHQISVPVLLVAGQEDKVTPYQSNTLIIERLLNIPHPEPFILPGVGHQVMVEEPDLVHAVVNTFLIKKCHLTHIDPTHSLQLIHIPHSHSPPLSAIDNTLLDNTLSIPLSIIHHNTLGDPPTEKWSLKNTAKWAATLPVGELVGMSRLRGMKVLRSSDPLHNPRHFIKLYPRVGLVLDISKDAPPYDITELTHSSNGVDETNVKYQKLSTVSKVTPTRDEVTEFCHIVLTYLDAHPDRELAIHCHYGFNRTGFMVCCYLIDVMGVPVSEAIQQYQTSRPPGIRHLHFKDELYLRYRPRNRVRNLTNGKQHVASEGKM